MSEFLPVAILILLLGLGGMEIAYWMYVRQAVSLALLQAARTGSTEHASPQSIAQSFEDSLLVLHASAGKNAPKRLATSLQTTREQTGGAPWRIEILSPTPADFRIHGSSSLPLSRQTGMPAINNDYQHEQHLRNAGAPGAGSIYQANTLGLRLIYLHRPLLPGIGLLLQSIQAGTDSYASQAMRHGLLPMMRYLQLGMESHPLQWPDLPDGRVIAGRAAHSMPPDTSGSLPECTGGWCLPTLPSSYSPNDSLPEAIPSGPGGKPADNSVSTTPEDSPSAPLPEEPDTGLCEPAF